MGYTYLDHATDAIVEVEAETLDEAFAFAAESVADITLDRGSVREARTRPLSAQGRDLELALLDWLEAANYLIITDGFAARRFEAHVEGGGPYTVSGLGHGEDLDTARHGFKLEVKAPTIHGMEISRGPAGVRMRFLLDL